MARAMRSLGTAGSFIGKFFGNRSSGFSSLGPMVCGGSVFVEDALDFLRIGSFREREAEEDAGFLGVEVVGGDDASLRLPRAEHHSAGALAIAGDEHHAFGLAVLRRGGE